MSLPKHFFKAAFEHSAISKLVYWPDGKLLYVSPAMQRLLGYDDQTLAGLSLAAISHPADRDQELTQLQQVLSEPAASPVAAIEKRFLSSRGEYVWCLQHLMALWRKDGDTPRLQCLVAEIQDIHSRKLYEAARAAERERLLMVEAMAHLGSWEVRFDTAQFWLSDECCRILGLDPDALEPAPLMHLGFVHPQDRELVYGRLTPFLRPQALVPVGESAGDQRLNFRIVRPGGEIRFVTSMARQTCDQQGTANGLSGFIMDITAYRLQEEMLSEANRLLTQQNQQLRQLARRLSETLQQPLKQSRRLLEAPENPPAGLAD